MASSAPINLPVTKSEGQRSINWDEMYLARFTPAWNRPPTVDGNAWRNIVARQPIASLCKDTLISSLLSLDWKITPRDSELQDELAGNVRYYTRLLERSGYAIDLDYTGHVEWVAGDLLDTPFGGAAEIGRKEDKPDGRVQWVEPLDSATLYPTLNANYPVVQYVNNYQVAFPRHAIGRVYMKPRPRIEYKGWGMCPPEIVYLALDMLARGDVYYANLLLDIPTTGILDLGDMEKESAIEWVGAYKDLLANGGNSSFKIPVLYEHQNDVKFVPFGKVPNDIMFDNITLKYAAIVCAAYGMTLSDLGISTTSNGGETLAGSIRSERKTRKTGFAKLKKKMKFYFEQILPPMLQFNWVDYDDEVNVALGRARMANATAFTTLSDKKVITEQEARQQLIADGMFTISMPEAIPASAVKVETVPTSKPGNQMGNANPVAPSMGGQGAIKKSQLQEIAAELIENSVADILAIRSDYEDDNLFVARTSEQLNGYVQELHRVKSFLGSDQTSRVLEDVIQRYALQQIFLICMQDDPIDISSSESYDLLLNMVVSRMEENLDEIFSSTKELMEAHEKTKE